jgi:hypothetical protein
MEKKGSLVMVNAEGSVSLGAAAAANELLFFSSTRGSSGLDSKQGQHHNMKGGQ